MYCGEIGRELEKGCEAWKWPDVSCLCVCVCVVFPNQELKGEKLKIQESGINYA